MEKGTNDKKKLFGGIIILVGIVVAVAIILM